MDKLYSLIGCKLPKREDREHLAREWRGVHLHVEMIGDVVFADTMDIVLAVETWRRAFPNGSPTGKPPVWIMPTESDFVAMTMLERN